MIASRGRTIGRLLPVQAFVGLLGLMLMASCVFVPGDPDPSDSSVAVIVVSPCSLRETVDAAFQSRLDDPGADYWLDAAPALCRLDGLPEVGTTWWAEGDHWWIVLEQPGADDDLSHSRIEELRDERSFERLAVFCDGDLELWQRLPSSYDVSPKGHAVIDKIRIDLEQGALAC